MKTQNSKVIKRIMATVMAVVMVLSILPVSAVLAEEATVVGWGQGQAGSFCDAGWEITGADYKTGSLTFEMKGSSDKNKDHHPQLVNQSLHVDANKYKKLEITYINTTDNTEAQFYFLEEKDISGGFQGGDRGIGFQVEANSEEEKVVTVAVGDRGSWQGTIGAIRFNPVNTDAATGLTGKFEIISMKFVGEDAETPAVGWGQGQIGSFHDAGWEITGADYKTGSLTFEMKGSSDKNKDHHPQLVNQSLHVDASKYQKLEITYINTTDNTEAQFYFLEDKDISGGFQVSNGRGIGFQVEANSEAEKVVTLQFDGNTGWTGTIGAIRFNPVNTDDATGLTGKFEIISMRFVGEEAETPVEGAIAWGKDKEAKLKDWRVEDAVPSYEADGSVILNITGPDTKLIHENLNIDAGTYKSLKVTYVNHTPCKIGEAYFIPASQGNNGFQPQTNVTYEVAADGKAHTLYIPFADNGNWNGTIKGVRMDPVKDLNSGSFQVISMEFVENAAPELEAPCEWDWDEDGDFLDWTCNSVIVNPEVKDSCLILPVAGEDPNVNSPKVSFSAELYPTMEIVYKNETDNTDSEIFWNNGTGINQACATTFRVENDGEWHTLRVNLSNHENWNGKIQGLRYDPVRSGEGTFTIDSIKFIRTSVCDGSIATEWEWRVDNNAEGWKAERSAATIKDGRAVLTLDGQNDPIFSVEKEVNVDAKNFRTLELTYKNNTDQTNAEFYWGDADGQWVAADGVHVKGFTTVNDGQWHTLRIPLRDVPNWNGTVTKLRIDPTGDGGTGTFELDRVAVLYDGEGETGRYELENGYFSISGAKGMIDKIAFDATGSGHYSEDLISGLVYMKMDADDVPYDVYSDAATAVVEGNTLTISNIRFGTPEMIGKWILTLDGSKMSNCFELDTQGEQVTLKNAGYVVDMLWDNNTDEVKGEEGKPGSLKVPFSKMASASDRYHHVYAFKYMPEKEDISTLGLEGEWIDWEGTNGFDFNLRFEADTEFVSPVCSIDNLRYLFRQPDVGQVKLDGSETFTRTLDITVSESKDITPEHFAKYESEGNELVAKALNDIMWELGYSREPASGQMDWAEWTSLTRAWRQDHYYPIDKNQLTNIQQITEDNYEEGDPGIGYIYTWSTSKGWPFPTNRDSNHYLTSTANYLNAVYNFYSYNDDEAFLDANLEKMRLGMDYLLTQFSDAYGVFLIDHPDHDGVADLSDNEGSLTHESRMRDAVGSNYWDVTPYGYLSAYDNIYCYLALVRTAELEEKLGNTARAEELNQYAQTLKTSYNQLFWKEDHYIQTIDAKGEAHDYGAVYLNLEAINYGLASEEQAVAIMNYLDTTETSSGKADVFSRFAFSPRATMFDNQYWYVYQYGNPGAYGVKQLQNGGGNMYTMYYELMCWIKTGNSDRAYERIKEMAEFFNTHHHLQGNKDIEGVGKAQHFGEGIVGIWGEFPESGLVPVAVKDGFMGIQASLSALEITPNMPTQMPEVSLDSVDYNGLRLRITTSNDSVTIKALKNESGCEWEINGELVKTDANGLFTRTIAISKGDTVVLAKAEKEDPKPVYTPTAPSANKAHVCPSAGFTDVDMSQYYHEAVDWAVTNNITEGTSASAFSPDASCTRAQMVTFLWRAAGSPVVNYAMRFTDVDEGAYYAEAVRWAVSEGITKGTSDTAFSPDTTVTRGQVVTFLYRYEQTQGGGMQGTWTFQNPFTDVDLESYYGEAVMWSVANDVTHGSSDTTFSPESVCTRAQIVTFLYRSFTK